MVNEYTTCECWNCGINIEFNVSAVDSQIGAPMITCPNCFKDTQLYVPGTQLTVEAQDFLHSLTAQSVPVFVSKRLERMALANGIRVSKQDSAESIIRQLQLA